jgi:16S rRNA (cytosine967-C5)-methyltransferase
VAAARAPYAPHTLVDQAVTAAAAAHKASASFVNAVLRRFLREREDDRRHGRAGPGGAAQPSGWWAERLRRDWPEHWAGAAGAEQPAAADDAARERAARACGAAIWRLRNAAAEARVRHAHVVLARPARCRAARLRRRRCVGAGRGRADGAPLLLRRRRLPGRARARRLRRPGGKTAHLLELADLDVLALDSDPRACSASTTRCAAWACSAGPRAPTPHARHLVGRPPFDAILLDAPCTRLRHRRRHPDVRWLRRPATSRRWPQTRRPARRACGRRCSRRAAAVLHVLGLQGAKASTRSTLFCNADRRRPCQAPESPGTCFRCPTMEPRLARPSSVLADGFYYALLEKT